MGVRKRSIFTRLFVLLAALLLAGNAVLGLVAYSRSEQALFTQIQNNAKNIAQCAAMHVNGEYLQLMKAGDENTEEYSAIIEELALFRDNADIEYIYTLREVGDKTYEFVVDSDTEEPAAIGDEMEYTQACGEAFEKGTVTADDEPFTDEWGSHVSAYCPIYVEDEIVGAVGVDISANWIDEQMSALRNLVIIICVVTYIVSLIVLWLLMSGFKRGMIKLNDKVKELASGSGDLTKEIDIDTGDELEVIADNVNAFIGQIRNLVKDVAQSSDEILQMGEEMSVTVGDNTTIMSGMNTEIESISANMEESAQSSKMLSQSLSESADDIAAFVQKVDEIRQMVQKANENAQITSAEAIRNRKNALDTIQVMQAKMVQASKDAEKIEQVKKIAEEISNIASQTSMLSLNAQIEAARAGALGSGFAVVATEVGHLSNDIDKAVSQINDINSQVLAAVSMLSEVLDEMVRFVSEDVTRDYDSFAALGKEYGKTTAAIRMQMVEIGQQGVQISQNIADINANVQDITETVIMTADSANDLAQSTRQISESFENMSTTAQRNSQHSENLSNQVNKYSF